MPGAPHPRVLLAVLALGAILVPAAPAADPGAVNQRGDGWPRIDGLLLINAHHGDRPLNARIGHDPFMGTDPLYRCHGERQGGECIHKLLPCGETGLCVSDRPAHNELLGGHGNDTIFAGPFGDVVWGAYLPYGPSAQRDTLTGGMGRDFIYGSKGRNVIRAGRGDDFVKARYGSGRVDCGRGRDILYTSRRYRHRYTIRRCERVSVGPSPGQGGTPTG
jgi:Ca2+-binding RTX toxin-like protein